jgi:P pilus assembly chaperone PapD
MSRQLAVALALAMAVGAPARAQPAPPPSGTLNATVTNVGAFLNITPRRITFDHTRRNATVFILNQGTEASTVDITLVDRVMLQDGQIVPTDTAGDAVKASSARLRSAHELIQISPRRVTLSPGKGQTIRLRLSTLPEGDPGEYRTHLTVTTLPPRDTGATAEAAAASGPAGQLSFQVTAIYGLSIPVIVRPTDPDVRAVIEGAHVEFRDISPDGRAPPKRTAILALDLIRQGPTSLFGNFEVHPVAAKKGDEPIGLARGVGVYPEVDRRTVRIPLVRTPNAGEQLEVTFTDDDTSPGKVLAKASF